MADLYRGYGFEFEIPEPPDFECERLISTFKALSERRREGYGSTMPLSFPEIESYCRLYRVEMSSVFVDWLLDLDRTFIDASEDVRTEHKAREG